MPANGQRWVKIDDDGGFPVCSQAKMGRPPSSPEGPDLDAAMLDFLGESLASRIRLKPTIRFSEPLIFVDGDDQSSTVRSISSSDDVADRFSVCLICNRWTDH